MAKDTQGEPELPEDTPLKPKESGPMLEPGNYKGTVTGMLIRTDPYAYVDFIVEVDVPGVPDGPELKVGYPMSTDADGNLYISTRGSLSAMLKKFGVQATDETTVGSLKQDMLNRKVQMLVMQDETDRGTFSRIMKESLKPE